MRRTLLPMFVALVFSSVAGAGPLGSLEGDAVSAARPANPFTSGQPVVITWQTEGVRAARGCTSPVPDSRFELSADIKQICLDIDVYRAVNLTAREPDPQRFERWLVSRNGETFPFTPEGELTYFAECRSQGGGYKIYRETQKGCIRNGGVLTADVRSLRSYSKVPPTARAVKLAIRRNDWDLYFGMSGAPAPLGAEVPPATVPVAVPADAAAPDPAPAP